MNLQHNFLTSLLLSIFLMQGCSKKETPPPIKPNILFAIADDASFPHMGAYGTDWINTPGFDRVAREGILFTRAYTPNAKCAPSRSCIITGRNSWQLEEAANHWSYFPQKFKTYAETLIENGYHVGYTAKGWAPGVALTNTGEKRELLGPAYNKHKLEPPAKYINSNDYTENFRDFLATRSGDQPFCFWYGSTEPHRGYEFGAGIKNGGKLKHKINEVFSFWPDTDSVRTDLLDYAFEIEYFDKHLVNMLTLLEEAGELNNTLVVVTADNGMPFPRIKGQEYEYSNHLPLAIMWPEGIKNPGRTVKDYVSFIDFAPTFLEVAGIKAEESGMKPMAGKSLTDIFNAKTSGVVTQDRKYVLIGKERHDVGRPDDHGYPIRGIVKDDFLYIENFTPERWPAGNPETGYLNTDGSPTKTVILNMRRTGQNKKYWELNFGKRNPVELYHVNDDPECMYNLAGKNNFSNLQSELKKLLHQKLEEQRDPRLTGDAAFFDSIVYADKSGRNFYERYMNGEEVNFGWVNASDFEKEPIDE